MRVTTAFNKMLGASWRQIRYGNFRERYWDPAATPAL